MKKKRGVIISILLLSFFFMPSLSLPNSLQRKSDRWQEWLDEVDLIITRSEKAVFKSLKTEEDRKRFQISFWKVRDPDPETAQNEFMIKFYSRRKYAESRLDGVNSDRGKIYILMGEPVERRDYSGYERVLDCELWIYRGEERPGLPPFVHLLFFKPRNSGYYRLFYPGHYTAVDLLSPGYRLTATSRLQAYHIIRAAFPELAHATLSVIPGEGSIEYSPSATSSGTVFTQIYTLPEREVAKSYLRNFSTLEGIVDVTYTTKEIGGKGDISISENRGCKFLNYSIMPDVIHTIKRSDNSHEAKININLRIEDLEGKTIYQREKEIDLKIEDTEKKAQYEERKLVFRDFVPIVEGDFNVSITFSNKTAEEFFVYTKRINISDKTMPVLVGYKVGKISSDRFIPFSSENYKILSDPRSIFNRNDYLEGIIFTDQKPEILLVSIEEDSTAIEIKDIMRKGNLFLFRQPLKDIKAGNYLLDIKTENEGIYSKIISVLSFNVKKPIDFERADASTASFYYIFVMGQQYFNKGDVDKAIEYYQRLPEDLWNPTTLPVIARAYYIKEDHGKVIELLERKSVEKNYTVLLLLGNSSLKLNRLRKAAEYFEMLRKYGDTVNINQTLGAIYYSLGEREKAEVYWERAKNLEKKSKKNNLNKKKEQ